ncbi:MAG: TatD family hydrolase [Kangiellaceae bacterium]
MQDNSKLKWIDIGVNLTNKRFNKDRDDVIHRAIKVGVEKQIITGTNVDESMQAFALTKGYPNVLYSTAGCHPHEAKDFKTTDLDKLQNLLKRTSVVAVGECGLDFNRNFSPKADQLRVFEQQLELAVDCQKPVFLHERDAFEEQYKLLKSFSKKLKGGVVHCFTGDAKHMQAYLDLGFYIGITGWICDERRGKDLFNQVHLIPADKLLLETDAPYLLPRDLKPKPKSSRNLPEFLPHIAKRIAQARNVDLEELALHCYDNTKRLFNI